MIIKGSSRAAAAQAGNYLLDLKKNDYTKFIETKGTISPDINGAMREMEAIAAGTKCQKFLYHASINPPEGANLTPDQWAFAVDLLEKNLGFEGHQRVVAEHFKDGRAHRHIIWNRVNPDTMKAVHMSNSFHAHELTARELEKTFGLDRVQGVHVLEENERPAERGPTHNETKQAEKSGVSVYAWRKEVRAIAADAEKTGVDLITALESKGHMVARGDKVPFVLLDPSGKAHRMAQSLGLRVDDLKERLEAEGIKPEELPLEKEARERQKAQQAELEKEKGFTMYDRGGMASQQADALRHIKEKEKTKKGRTAREVYNEVRKAEQLKRAKEAGREAGKRKENTNSNQQGGGGAPREQQTRKVSQQEHRRATTEQTDRKQRISAKEAMREVFEKDFSKSLPAGGQQKERDGFERERERER